MRAEKKVITLIRPRSASVNAALELVGLDRQIYVHTKKDTSMRLPQ